MSRTIYIARRAILGLGLAGALLAAPVLGQEETDRFGTAKNVTLTAVRTTPHAYKNVWIKFQGHYGGIGAVHNPSSRGSRGRSSSTFRCGATSRRSGRRTSMTTR